MKILHIDSCVRENSRTRRLANYLLEKLGGRVEICKLNDAEIFSLNNERLKLRDELIQKSNFSHQMFDYAKQFIDADIVVVSAPFWDLSFPSSLKTYFENINVCGLVFKYSDEGCPMSLCKAQKLYYITTSGGPMLSDDYGFNYVKALCSTFYGIDDIECIKAKGLDIYGADTESILNNARQEIDKLF